MVTQQSDGVTFTVLVLGPMDPYLFKIFGDGSSPDSEDVTGAQARVK